MSTILVVDDKEMMRDSVATTLSRKNHTVVTAHDAKMAIEKLGQRPFDLVITDLQMPQMDGIELLSETRRIDEQLPVIVMTAYGTVDSAVAAMKRGAYDYITKPFSGDALLATVQRALEHSRLMKENSILRAAATPAGIRSCKNNHELIGESPTMSQLQHRLARLADSHGTVLISGESGSGKEVAARWIHEQSPRASMPFLALNCAALSTSLLESELFGHEKGAFTGADRLRKGRFELAEGGTLLLDEISEIAPEIQAKLLRVLQERSYERVGSSVSRSVDVRVIATTNRNLPAEVAKGAFRQDLYFRLNVLPLVMPPLREHLDDLPALISYFLAQVSLREGKPIKTMEGAAIDRMRMYAWPGNVRELQNICERAAVLTPDPVIAAALIAPWLNATIPAAYIPMSRPLAERSRIDPGPASLPGSMIEVTDPAPSQPSELQAIICDGKLRLEDIERQVIIATIEHNRGHRQRSAAALGIGVRTLGLKLKKWKQQQLVAATL
ncbi:MAG: sigma-54 dependent transcriptional regulator [Phycisphaerales bacterium]|nr:sigma-54 dependent transcriptional regulator [Phycisphaerales bacterium]MCI0630962.1 sigma-54 dependent transcriptional regulator [Phycisphaerales bacterium]MCI0674325.1 sigma-54 dependent transcriptional regulator [Phycisphaerales bacterium]